MADERIVKLLPVKLTKEEWDERAKAVARLSDEIADAERRVESEKEAAKARVQDANSVLEGLRAKQRSISRVVREGQEEREVSCSVAINRAKLTETVTRDHTHAVVETNPISTARAKEGARWCPNFERDLCELVHPDERGTVLDTRPISDGERQQALPVDEKKSKRSKKHENGEATVGE